MPALGSLIRTPRQKFQILDHLHVVVHAEKVGHIPDQPADFLGMRIYRIPAYRGFAPGGLEQRGQDPHGRGLARVVRADIPEQIPFHQLQRKVVNGPQFTVDFRPLVPRFDHGRIRVQGLTVSTGSPGFLNLAKEQELDLVEVSPKTVPPVCKIMDYGKFKYQLAKKAHDARKKQAVVHIKEMKLGLKIEEHDLRFKIKHLERVS